MFLGALLTALLSACAPAGPETHTRWSPELSGGQQLRSASLTFSARDELLSVLTVFCLRLVRLLIVIILVWRTEPLKHTHTTINPSRHEYVCGLIYVLSTYIYIYLIRPHEANEEDDGKAHSDDIDPPEPRSLHRRHQQLFNHSGLQEDRVKYRRRFSFLECLSEAYLLLSISSHLPSLDGFIWTCQ